MKLVICFTWFVIPSAYSYLSDDLILLKLNFLLVWFQTSKT
jgi:hypothetical protein